MGLPARSCDHREMAAAGSWRIETLTPARGADYLRFFDHERGPAFADNREWATCYCHYYEVPPALKWGEFDGSANRTAMAARIASGEMEGFLAYEGDDVVGWRNAQPDHKLLHACARLRSAPSPLPVAPHVAAAIVCFVTAPARRRQGIARALLAAAIASFTARGLASIVAFPWNTGPHDAKATDHYHGTLSMFIAAGFEAIATHESLTVVRKSLR
jgi:ribosomal protein S18 acetylase RimI-like enzyme